MGRPLGAFAKQLEPGADLGLVVLGNHACRACSPPSWKASSPQKVRSLAAFRAVPTRQATLAVGICLIPAASSSSWICGSRATSFGFFNRWYSGHQRCASCRRRRASEAG